MLNTTIRKQTPTSSYLQSNRSFWLAVVTCNDIVNNIPLYDAGRFDWWLKTAIPTVNHMGHYQALSHINVVSCSPRNGRDSNSKLLLRLALVPYVDVNQTVIQSWQQRPPLQSSHVHQTKRYIYEAMIV